jgi:hypothetical protein
MADPSSHPRLPALDRHFWLVVAAATLVLLVRAVLILSAHNEIMDSQFHLRSGIALLTGNPGGIIDPANDAPLGQILMAAPIVMLGVTPDKPIDPATWPAEVSRPGEPPTSPQRDQLARTIRRAVLYGNYLRPETILLIVGLWKSLLFVPCIAVVFQWCRALYGLRAGWLAAALVLVDPTFAAHVPVVALDTLGVEGIVIACFCLWRYFEAPATRSLATASAAMAVAVLLKHTAVIVPGVALLMAAWYWVALPLARRQPWRDRIRPRLGDFLRGALIFLLGIWVLTGFDFSAPSRQFQGAMPHVANESRAREVFLATLDRPWPGGVYVGRIVSGFLTSGQPHRAFMWGEIKPGGWWYYFPVLATYKVPIGIGVVALLGVASLAWVRWRSGEMSLFIPLLCWAALLMSSNLNIGFRHFLPAYVFVLMLASRCVADGRTWSTIVAWLGVAAAAIHVVSYHPDNLSYLNFPRDHWWMRITESNVDWGQSLRKAARWIDEHPQAGKPIHFAPRWDRQLVSYEYLVGRRRATLLDRGATPPRSGILIISPVWVTGVYDAPDASPYAFLRAMTPIDVIGHALLVYDLGDEGDTSDRTNAAPATAPAARSGSSSGSIVTQPR